MLKNIIWWLRGTTLYCDLKYERYVYPGIDDKFQKILAAQQPNQFFRIGWLILFTNKSKKCAWIYSNQKEGVNHG